MEEYIYEQPQGNKFKHLVTFLLIAIIVVAGILAFKSEQNDREILMNAINNLMNEDKGRVQINISAKTEPRDLQLPALELLGEVSGQIDDYVQEFDANLSLSGYFGTEVVASGNNVFALSSNSEVDGQVMNFSLDAVKKGNEVYFKIEDGPQILFFDFGMLNGDWIKIDLENDLDITYTEDDIEEEQVKKIIDIILKNEVITGMDTSEKTEEMYVYSFKIDKEKIPLVYMEIVETLEEEYGDSAIIKKDEAIVSMFLEDEFNQTIDLINQITDFKIYVSQKTLEISKILFDTTIIGSNEDEKQINMTMEINLEGVEDGWDISAPETYMNSDQAMEAMFGGISLDGIDINWEEVEGDDEDINNGMIKMYFEYIVSEASIHYMQNNSYTGLLDNSNLAAYIQGVKLNNNSFVEGTISSDGQGYCFQAPLFNGTDYWCVDSTGYAGESHNCTEENSTCN